MSIHTHRWSNSKGRYRHCTPRRVEVTYRPSIGTDPLLYVAGASFPCWFVITSTSPSVCRLREKGPVRTASFASTPKISWSPLSNHGSISLQRSIVTYPLGTGLHCAAGNKPAVGSILIMAHPCSGPVVMPLCIAAIHRCSLYISSMPIDRFPRIFTSFYYSVRSFVYAP